MTFAQKRFRATKTTARAIGGRLVLNGLIFFMRRVTNHVRRTILTFAVFRMCRDAVIARPIRVFFVGKS